MRKLFFMIALGLISFCSQAQDISKGLWFNEEKDGKIQFFEQNGKLFGKIVWLKEPNNESGKPKTDINNPNSTQKGKPIIGLVFLKNFKKDGNNWKDGEVYDPKTGKT